MGATFEVGGGGTRLAGQGRAVVTGPDTSSRTSPDHRPARSSLAPPLDVRSSVRIPGHRPAGSSPPSTRERRTRAHRPHLRHRPARRHRLHRRTRRRAPRTPPGRQRRALGDRRPVDRQARRGPRPGRPRWGRNPRSRPSTCTTSSGCCSWPSRPACWPPPWAPTSSTASWWSRPASGRAPTTATSPASRPSSTASSTGTTATRGERGVRVVPCCGFDSIPHDLGVRFTVAQLPSDQPITVRGYVRAKGLPSGGTWNSAVKAIGETDLRSTVGGSGSGSRGSSTGRRGPGGCPCGSSARASSAPGACRCRRSTPPWCCARPGRSRPTAPTSATATTRTSSSWPPSPAWSAGPACCWAWPSVGPTRDLLLQAAPVRRGPVRGPARVRLVPVHLPRRGGRRPARHHPGVRRRPRLHRDRRDARARPPCRWPRTTTCPRSPGVLTTAQAFEGGALQRRLEDQGMRFEVLDRG